VIHDNLLVNFIFLTALGHFQLLCGVLSL